MSSRSVILSTSMLVARAHTTAAEATSDADRPAFHYVYKPADVPAAATAVPPPSPEYSAAIAAHAARPPSEQALHPMCFAYARLTVPNRNPGRVIFETILEAAFDLIWTLVALLPSAHGTMVLRFPTPAHREDAMRLQPFGYAGGAVTLVRAWDTSILDDYLIHRNPQHLVRSPDDLLVHVALHRYPAEQRTERDIGANCRGFGWVLEVRSTVPASPRPTSPPSTPCSASATRGRSPASSASSTAPTAPPVWCRCRFSASGTGPPPSAPTGGTCDSSSRTRLRRRRRIC